MSATHVIRRLLEEQDDPADFGALEPYLGPVEFDNNVKDILNHARLLKEQAEQAGALAHVLRAYKPLDVDRAFLTIAVEQYNDELRAPGQIARRLKREMHSIWT